jgi:hypothetical protein
MSIAMAPNDQFINLCEALSAHIYVITRFDTTSMELGSYAFAVSRRRTANSV